jgi:hypothetical protein
LWIYAGLFQSRCFCDYCHSKKLTKNGNTSFCKDAMSQESPFGKVKETSTKVEEHILYHASSYKNTKIFYLR